MEIKVKYKNQQMKKLHYVGGSDHSNWIDLYTVEDVTMKTGDFQLIDLGVVIEVPKGYESRLLPRSSTFNNYGILQANSEGVIDQSFCGPNDWWLFPAYATRDVVIPKGTRIAQFRVVERQPDLEFIEIEESTNPNRGGIGSTGKN